MFISQAHERKKRVGFIEEQNKRRNNKNGKHRR